MLASTSKSSKYISMESQDQKLVPTSLARSVLQHQCQHLPDEYLINVDRIRLPGLRGQHQLQHHPPQSNNLLAPAPVSLSRSARSKDLPPGTFLLVVAIKLCSGSQSKIENKILAVLKYGNFFGLFMDKSLFNA